MFAANLDTTQFSSFHSPTLSINTMAPQDSAFVWMAFFQIESVIRKGLPELPLHIFPCFIWTFHLIQHINTNHQSWKPMPTHLGRERALKAIMPPRVALLMTTRGQPSFHDRRARRSSKIVFTSYPFVERKHRTGWEQTQNTCSLNTHATNLHVSEFRLPATSRFGPALVRDTESMSLTLKTSQSLHVPMEKPIYNLRPLHRHTNQYS